MQMIRKDDSPQQAPTSRDNPERTLNPVIKEEDLTDELNLRPKTFNDFIGQEKIKENLGAFITAARQRNEPLDHVLFCGPPGLGKTTLATIIANELKVNIRSTSGPVLERQGDLAAILTNLADFDILLIDEIHRLPRIVEEVLYPAMEDYQLFFQAEDGIRDWSVTGVQTCALPI